MLINILLICMVFIVPFFMLWVVAAIMERNYKEKSKYEEVPTHFQIICKELRAIMHDYYQKYKDVWVRGYEFSIAQEALYEYLKKKKTE